MTIEQNNQASMAQHITPEALFGFADKQTLFGIYRRMIESKCGQDFPRLLHSVVQEKFNAFYKRVKESADSCDFACLQTDTGKQLVQNFMGASPDDLKWRMFCGETDVPNFNKAKRMDFSSAPDLEHVPENMEPQDLVYMKDRCWDIMTDKYGRKFGISFETLVNDDVGVFNAQAEKMAIAGIRTQARNLARFINSNPATFDGFQMWSYNHRNVWTNGLTGVDLYSAYLILQLIFTMIYQTDTQCDEKTKAQGFLQAIADGNAVAGNEPRYIVANPAVAFIVGELLTHDMIPDTTAAPTLLVPNPLRQYFGTIKVLSYRYLPLGLNNVYLFCDPSSYTPSFVFAYLNGTGRGPIVMRTDENQKVLVGSGVLSEFNAMLKITFTVWHFWNINTQTWEGTAAIIPNFHPGADECQTQTLTFDPTDILHQR